MQINFADSTIVFMQGNEIEPYNEVHNLKPIQLPCEGTINPDWIKKFCCTPLGYAILMEDKRKTNNRFHKPQMLLYSELMGLILESENRDAPFDLVSLHFSNTCGKQLMKWFKERPTAVPPWMQHPWYSTCYIVNQEQGLESFLRNHLGEKFQSE